MRLNVKQLQNKKWAAFCGSKYYLDSVRDTEREAKIARLHQIGRDAQRTIDNVDKELEKLGALDVSDPHGYLC